MRLIHVEKKAAMYCHSSDLITHLAFIFKFIMEEITGRFSNISRKSIVMHVHIQSHTSQPNINSNLLKRMYTSNTKHAIKLERNSDKVKHLKLILLFV